MLSQTEVAVVRDLVDSEKVPWGSLIDDRLEEFIYLLLLEFEPVQILRRGASHAADGGRDIEAVFNIRMPDDEKQPQLWWAEAKGRSNRGSISAKTVESAISSAQNAERAVDVLVVATNAAFAPSAIDVAMRHNDGKKQPAVRLWDRSRLSQLIRTRPRVALRTCPDALTTDGKLAVLGELEGSEDAIRRQYAVAASLAGQDDYFVGASLALGIAPGSVIAGTVTSRSDLWTARVRPVMRGSRYPVRFASVVEFEPPSVGLHDGRDELYALAGEAMGLLGADWSNPIRHPELAYPELVLAVPEFLAPLPASEHPSPDVTAGIAVVGGPAAGGPDIARVLAGHLGWAYQHASDTARRRWRLMSHQEESRTRQTEIARQLLLEADVSGRQLCLSMSSLEPIEDLAGSLSADGPIIIYLKGSEHFLRSISSEEPAYSRYSYEHLRAVFDSVELALEDRSSERTLVLHVPDIIADNLRDADANFDQYVDMAFAVGRWLHDTHGGPWPMRPPGAGSIDSRYLNVSETS
jgi:hypothetical protein